MGGLSWKMEIEAGRAHAGLYDFDFLQEIARPPSSRVGHPRRWHFAFVALPIMRGYGS